MSTFATLQQEYSRRVDAVLTSVLSSLPFQQQPVVQAMRYGALLGGKRLRPFLVYATGKMFHLDLANLDAPAAAIECIHAYSLIHDDLPAMDNDDLRRGMPTCHIKFGEANAILAGDALQTLAFSILAELPMNDVSMSDRLAMISELSCAGGAKGMCIGQALDLTAEGRQIDLQELEQIHRHKTGALIIAAVRLGALAAGDVGREALPLLDRFSQAIGLAFQVQDDILDVIGDTAKIGKRQGSDQQHQKSTYPALLGIAQAQEKASLLYQDALSVLNTLKRQNYDVSQLEALANFIVERDN
jgi:farnesyl diphosphate synthase